MTDTTTYPVPEAHPPPTKADEDAAAIDAHRRDIGLTPSHKPTRPDPDAWRAIEAERLTDAEKELAYNREALEAAKAKVADLTAEVAFDQMKVKSRADGLATFDRLRAKAAK